MKRRIISWFLAAVICVFLAGCSENAQYILKDGFKKIDVDLTALSGTMVYAEVYNMMVNPTDYLGKTVKLSGPYSTRYYDVTDEYYHYVIVEDATACCQQGLEFIWSGQHVFPDDYPVDQTEIEILGIFDSYEELGNTFFYIKADDLSVI
ncbi:MAG: hypothetical protein LBR74_02645 [Eubacterium sp.]|jgi:hypothetical protein|nr:hypothetical protein [Eubacterium sp.]